MIPNQTLPTTPTIRGALLYRINVAEAKLGVSRSTIYRLVNEGQLVLVKIGKRSSGITVESILALIERNKNNQ
jgi:excisionase family DNA binding protein